MVLMAGIEPTTSGLQDRRSSDELHRPQPDPTEKHPYMEEQSQTMRAGIPEALTVDVHAADWPGEGVARPAILEMQQ